MCCKGCAADARSGKRPGLFRKDTRNTGFAGIQNGDFFCPPGSPDPFVPATKDLFIGSRREKDDKFPGLVSEKRQEFCFERQRRIDPVYEHGLWPDIVGYQMIAGPGKDRIRVNELPILKHFFVCGKDHPHLPALFALEIAKTGGIRYLSSDNNLHKFLQALKRCRRGISPGKKEREILFIRNQDLLEEEPGLGPAKQPGCRAVCQEIFRAELLQGTDPGRKNGRAR